MSLRLVDGQPLVGSTHDQRVKALSAALRSIDRRKDRALWNAIYDCYLIVSKYQDSRG